MSTVSDPGYWNNLYLANDVGWDQGRMAPPIARMLEEGLHLAGRVAVLGAGRGHEAFALAERGLQVTAVDFAEEAVKEIRSRARATKLSVAALEADVFTLGQTHAGAFDAVLEHTCFCAVAPERRAEYAQVVRQILNPHGFYFGLFMLRGRSGEEGPPFPTEEGELRQLFAGAFELSHLKVAPDSFPSRAGRELEFIFRRTLE